MIVAGTDHPLRAVGSRGGELALRVGSALVLVPLAIGTAYLGGGPFAVFWGLAAMGVLWEWTSLVARSDHRTVLMTGGASLPLAVTLVATGHLLAAVIVLAISALGVASLAPAKWRTWIAAGVPYAGALGVAPIVLRSDNDDGFLAVRKRGGFRVAGPTSALTADFEYRFADLIPGPVEKAYAHAHFPDLLTPALFVTIQLEADARGPMGVVRGRTELKDHRAGLPVQA